MADIKFSEINKWRRGQFPHKYTVSYKGKDYSFGHQDYQQYRDRTPLGLYSSEDHLDERRRQLYHLRHSKNVGISSLLSKHYLW